VNLVILAILLPLLTAVVTMLWTRVGPLRRLLVGVSGVAQLAVSSTIAVAAMFAGGIGTAFLLLRRI